MNEVFDPTPVKHITNECVFCGQTISDDVLTQPGIIHADCHRPTCPDCIEDLKQTGLWGCWYCKTVDIDERNPEIQKELEKIREEKLRERRPDPPQEFGRMISTSGAWVSSSSSTEITSPWTGRIAAANTEDYPYRDPSNPLDQEGWGAPPIFDLSGEDEVKPGDFVQPSVDVFGKVARWNDNQADLMGVVGSKKMINKVTASWNEHKRIAHLIMAGEKIDNKAFGKDENYGQIYTRIDWNAADTIAGYNINEDTRSHIVAEIMKELEIYYDPNRIVEEAQRGTGRTIQRIKSVFGHFVDGAVGLRKYYDSRRLLYLVDSEREAKRINAVMAQEWRYGFYRKLGLTTLNTIRDRTDIMSIATALHRGTIGKHYTLVVADITYEAMTRDGEKINKMLQYIGAPIIGDVITG